MEVRFCDDIGFALGWIAPEPARLERASHALAEGGRVWLVDPVDGEGVEQRVRALGDPAGVIQLLDRHGRDCAVLAERLGVPLHMTPFDGMADSPFEVLPVVRRRYWREVALWWPERRVLVVADAVGSARYFTAPGEELGVHPPLKLFPPRSLDRLEPEHVLCGHGEGVHGAGAAAALHQALATSRTRIPRWLVGLARSR